MSKFEPVAICSDRRRMRGEARATTDLIAAAVDILIAQHPMTIRQLFYRLVGVGLIDNTQKQYQRVSRLMTIARGDGRCSHGWIQDRSRPEYRPNVWENASSYFETVKHSYRRDSWQDQPCLVEVWTEKDAIIGSIEPVTREYGVTVRVFRGFSSTTRANDITEIFNSTDRDIHVLYLGDHDPSGRDIERDISHRVAAFFDIQRVAIHASDIRKFNLPPQRIKATDTRARAFSREHGQECVELDALPPNELRQRLEAAISGFIDFESWNRHIVAEQLERKSILDFANRLASLPRGEMR